MKIGVLADTHITSLTAGTRLAEMLLAGPFAGVDQIIHAGDLVIPELESCFLPLTCHSVRGNMDPGQLCLPERRVLSISDKRIGVIHGWGAPHGIEQRVMAAFADQTLDALVFGHSHQPLCEQIGSMLLLNPGSPTDRRYAPRHTVGLLTIDEKLYGEIIDLDD